MTLPVGTSLQNGQYVLDAYCFTDSLGSTYLATEVPTSQRLQVKRFNTADLPMTERSRYLEQIAAVANLRNSNLVSPLRAFEEDEDVYLVYGIPEGIPLTHLLAKNRWFTDRRAVTIIHQTAAALEMLASIGIRPSLNVDQLWWRPSSTTLYLSGFAFPLKLAPRTRPPALHRWLINQLAQLLYFLVCGELATTTHAPLAYLRQQRPGLNPALLQALEKGLEVPLSNHKQTLLDWLRSLPLPSALDDDSIGDDSESGNSIGGGSVSNDSESVGSVSDHSTKGSVSVASLQMKAVTQPSRKWRSSLPSRQPLLVLGYTSFIASIAGLGFGLTLRFNSADASGQQVRFNPEQSFPPLSDWSGEFPAVRFDQPYAEFDQPYIERSWPMRIEPEVQPVPEREAVTPLPAVESASESKAPDGTHTWNLPVNPARSRSIYDKFDSLPVPALAPDTSSSGPKPTPSWQVESPPIAVDEALLERPSEFPPSASFQPLTTDMESVVEGSSFN